MSAGVPTVSAAEAGPLSPLTAPAHRRLPWAQNYTGVPRSSPTPRLPEPPGSYPQADGTGPTLTQSRPSSDDLQWDRPGTGVAASEQGKGAWDGLGALEDVTPVLLVVL